MSLLHQDLLLAVGLAVAVAVAGCGASKSDKKASSTRGAYADTSRPSVISRKPKTSTANTPLAKQEDCYKPEDEDLCAMAKRIIAITNELRAGQGLDALKMHAGWSHVATLWSQGQADVEAISHTGFPEARDAAYEKEFGTAEQPLLAAENVGRINVHSDDVEKISTTLGNGWWQSPSHHHNMVGDFTYLGVGLVRADDGFYYATQIFAWQSDEEVEAAKGGGG